VRWVDPQRPLEGLDFAGRITEDFKLMSGTWVQTSLVRRDLVDALQPYVVDAVICAPDRPWLGALVWLNVPATDDVRAVLGRKLTAFNAQRQGGAATIVRLLVLSLPPSVDAGEITDKRSINQRCVIERRADQVSLLYAEPAGPAIILPES
jgi:feruloyl-CoA synthase